MTMVRAFCIRGLIGSAYSRGMDRLADKLNQISGVSASAVGNDFFPVGGVVGTVSQECLNAHAAGLAIVLVGHSYGAYACQVVASDLQQLKRKIDVALLVLDDTTKDAPLVPDSGGVRVEYYQTQDPMGGGTPASVPGARTPLEQIKLTGLSHPEMADCAKIHDRVIAEIKKLLNERHPTSGQNWS